MKPDAHPLGGAVHEETALTGGVTRRPARVPRPLSPTSRRSQGPEKDQQILLSPPHEQIVASGEGAEARHPLRCGNFSPQDPLVSPEDVEGWRLKKVWPSGLGAREPACPGPGVSQAQRKMPVSVRETQTSCDFTPMGNLRNSTDEPSGRGRRSKMKTEREANLTQRVN